MEFIDLKMQYQEFAEQMQATITKVVSEGQYIMGTQVQELETRLANFTGVKHCIGVSDGTKALLLALMALGVGPGDEVIIPALTFIAPASMTALLGATPVFVDIDSRTYNIDPERIEAAIGEKTRAIIAVDLYGQCADFTVIKQIAAKYNLPVIEDAAQAFGAQHQSHSACSMTSLAITSFFPSKPLGCYGDGGAIFTNDDNLADKITKLRVHGQDRRYHHVMLGINGRLDTLQAAILLIKLTVFEDEIKLRQQVAGYYSKQIQQFNTRVQDDQQLVIPYVQNGNLHVYGQYSLLATSNRHRELILQRLKAAAIPAAVHYPIPLNQQPVFAKGSQHQARTVGNLVCAEDIANRVFSIPMHPYLTVQQQDRVIQALFNAHEE